MRILKTSLCAVLCLPCAQAFAAGTAANTAITNQASVEYDVGASTFTENSNILTITVDELIDVTVTWQDGGNVPVQPAATGQPLLYRVTNIGNGQEVFSLSGTNQAGDDFDINTIALFADDGDGVFEPGTDDASITDVDLAADAFEDVWISATIPAGGANGDLSIVRLTANADTGTGTAGDAFAGAGTGGVDAVVGTSGGTANDDGTFEIQDIVITVTKTATVADTFGGTQPVPGATITYSIAITATGSATATSVFFEDGIPANTSFTGSSIELDSVGQTDGNDGDDCDYDVTNTGGIYCDLPDMTGGDSHTVTFDVTID